MKRNPKRKKQSVKMLRLWTESEIKNALPYLRSVVGSLREHWLDLQSSKRNIDRLSSKPGRHDRDHLLAESFAQDSTAHAENRFQDTLAELSKIDIFAIDPVQGVALIPFRKGDDLAWYVYDQFDQKGLVGWRYHQDPLVKRRPLELLGPDQLLTNTDVA